MFGSCVSVSVVKIAKQHNLASQCTKAKNNNRFSTQNISFFFIFYKCIFSMKERKFKRFYESVRDKA